MRTINPNPFNVYAYDELGTEAKAKVKEWYLADEGLMQERAESFTEYIKEDIKCVLGYENSHNLDVQWSLSYSQGDGVNIYGKINIDDFISAIERKFDGAKELQQYAEVLTEHDVKTIRAYAEIVSDIELPYNHRYCYCIADRACVAEEIGSELEWARYNQIDFAAIEKFERVVVGVFETLCGRYEEIGYDELYDVEEQYLGEFLTDNDYWFLEDGTFYCIGN